MENLTSALVNGSPLWNLTFGRSLNSQVVSLVVFHSVASPGLRFRSGSRAVRLSKRLKDTVMSLTWVLRCGSSFEMSPPWTATRVSLFGGALAVATPGVPWVAGLGSAAGAAGLAASAGLGASVGADGAGPEGAGADGP